MDVAVRPELGAHVVQVVAGGELPPVLENEAIALVPRSRIPVAFVDGIPDRVELFDRVVLKGVAEPGRQVPLGVRPRDPVRCRVLSDRLVTVEHL